VLSSVAFAQVAQADARHVGMAVSTDVLQQSVKEGILHFVPADIEKRMDPVSMRQRLSFPEAKYATLVTAFRRLFDMDLARGLDVYISTGAISIAATLNREKLFVNIGSAGPNELYMTVRGEIPAIRGSIPALNLCTQSGCRRGDYIKFKDLSVSLASGSVPVQWTATFRAAIHSSVRLADGQIAPSGVAEWELVSVDTNLDDRRPPVVSIRYFKGRDSRGVEWPQLSPVQLGDNESGVTFGPADLVAIVDQLKANLGIKIIRMAASMIPEKAVTLVNTSMKRTLATGFVREDFSTQNPKAYIRKLVDAIGLGFYISGVNILNQSASGVTFPMDYANTDSSLLIDGRPISSYDYLGPGYCPASTPECAEQLGSLTFNPNYLKPICESGPGIPPSNFGVGLSEPYINAMLQAVQNTGFFNALATDLTGIPSRAIGLDPEQGVRVYFRPDATGVKAKYVLVANMVVNLHYATDIKNDIKMRWAEQYERWFGNTGGIVRFPLEVPVHLNIMTVAGKRYLQVFPQSPVYKPYPFAIWKVRHEMGGYSNLNDTADTFIADLKQIIADQVAIALNSQFMYPASQDRDRIWLKEMRFDLDTFLANLPVDVVPTGLEPDSNGYLTLYGDLRKINFLKIFITGQ
jgi:hypothetical protein